MMDVELECGNGSSSQTNQEQRRATASRLSSVSILRPSGSPHRLCHMMTTMTAMKKVKRKIKPFARDDWFDDGDALNRASLTV